MCVIKVSRVRSSGAGRLGRVIPLSLGCVLFSPSAFADFGPEVAFAIWHLLAFLAAIIVLPLNARPGRRLLWFFSVVIGYPLSFVLLSKFAFWVDTARYANDATALVLMLITWGWIFCVQMWLRVTRSRRAATSGSESSAPESISIFSDVFALITIVALLLESQAFVAQLTHLDFPVAIGAVIAYWAFPLCSVMGLWFRQQWAWWLALASTVFAMFSISLLLPVHFAQFADLSIGSLALVVLAIGNSVIAAFGLRLLGLLLLFVPLRKQHLQSSAAQ